MDDERLILRDKQRTDGLISVDLVPCPGPQGSVENTGFSYSSFLCLWDYKYSHHRDVT